MILWLFSPPGQTLIFSRKTKIFVDTPAIQIEEPDKISQKGAVGIF
jgi:hypothetical protein